MALTPDQLAQAQQWGNQQFGGGYDASGTFQPGTVNWNNYDPSNATQNWGILGAGQAMGYTPADMSQLIGGSYSAGDIQHYMTDYAPQIDSYAQSFRATQGGNYDPNASTVDSTGGGGGPGSPDWAFLNSHAVPGNNPAGYGGGATLDTTYHANPYLDQMAGNITTQFNNNLNRNVLPGISGGAAAVGGVGGSREGIAQGLAIGDSSRGLSSALTGMYGNDYEQSMARNLQKYGIDQNYGLGMTQAGNAFTLGQGNLALGNKQADYGYNLGLGNLGLGNQNSLQNFYTSNRGLDLQQQQLGANIYGLGSQGDWSGLNDANGLYNNYTGYGTNQTSTQGGGALGAAGGALAGYQLYGAGSGSGSGSGSNAYNNGGGFGTGYQYGNQDYGLYI